MFPASPAPDSHDLAHWNATDLWRSAFGDADPGLLFIAENVLGEQFGICDEGVFMWDPETLECTRMAGDLQGWAAAVMADPDIEVGCSLTRRWQAVHGPLPSGQRIRPRFVLFAWKEVDYSSLESYVAADAVELMIACADVGRQIRELPEGDQVRIQVLE